MTSDGAIVGIDVANCSVFELVSASGGGSNEWGKALAINTTGTVFCYCTQQDNTALQRFVSIDGSIIGEIPLGSNPAHCAVWLDDATLALGLDDGRVTLLRLEDDAVAVLAERPVHRDIVWTMHLARNANELITGSSDGTVSRLQVTDLAEIATLGGLTRGVWSTAWHDDGRLLLSAAGDGSVAIWDVDTSERSAHAQLAGGWIRYVCWSSASEPIAVAQKGVIYRLTTSLETRSQVELGLEGNIWCADYCRDSYMLALGTDLGEVGLYNFKTDSLELVHLRDRLISSVAWRTTGTLLVGTATGEGFELEQTAVGNWEAKVLEALQGSDEITAICEVSDLCVVAGFASGRIQLIDDSKLEQIMPGHSGPVQSLVGQKEGRLFTSGADGEIIHWDCQTQEKLSVHSLLVSTAGLSIAKDRISCGSGGVWVFDLTLSSKSPGHESISLSDPPPGLVDAPATVDLIGRVPLVDEIAFLCERTSIELDRQASDEEIEDRGFVIHVGGRWGSGKTSFSRMVGRELENRVQDGWVTGEFDAWQRAPFPPLVDLLGELDNCTSKVGGKFRRAYLAFRRFWINRPGLFRVFLSAVILGLAVAIGLRLILNVLVVKPAASTNGAIELNASNLSDFIQIGGALLACAAFLTGRMRSVVLGIRSLRSEPNSVRVGRYRELVLRRVPKKVLIIVDELDRCEPERVVEVLRACNELMLAHPTGSLFARVARRQRSHCIAFLLLAEKSWLYNSIEAAHAVQTDAWSVRTARMGTSFMEKLALLSFDLPVLSATARIALVSAATGEAKVTQLPLFQPVVSQISPDSGLREAEIEVTTMEAQQERRTSLHQPLMSGSSSNMLMPVLSSTGDPRNQELVERASEIERRMDVERKYIAQYATLIGSTPREIKRVLVRYWVDRVVALSEGRDVNRFAEAILFETIVSVRWPALATAIRSRENGAVLSALEALDVKDVFSELQFLSQALDAAWAAEKL
jgi:WD40 repeat protein